MGLEKDEIKKYDRWINNTKLKLSLYAHKFNEMVKTLQKNEEKIQNLYLRFINVISRPLLPFQGKSNQKLDFKEKR